MSKTRMCRYDCGTELGDFDEKQNKYLELSGTLHTRERCESLKNRTPNKTSDAAEVRPEAKATKNNVVDYMNSEDVPKEFRTSRVTTLDKLESGDRIKVLRGERRGQSHKLIINNESEFNKIDEQISKMDGVIDMFSEPISKLNQLGSQGFPGNIAAYKYKEVFVFPYIETIATMIHTLSLGEDGKLS